MSAKKTEKSGDSSNEGRIAPYNPDYDNYKKKLEAKKHCDEVKAAWDRWYKKMEEVHTTLFKLNNYIFSLFKAWSVFNKALINNEPSGQVKFPLLKKVILPPLNFYITKDSPLENFSYSRITKDLNLGTHT